MWWMIVVSAASCLAVLFLFGRRNERAVRRDWELLLTPKGEKLYKSIEGRVQSEMALADLTTRRRSPCGSWAPSRRPRSCSTRAIA